jgi:type I restriction enzyme S subunit
MTDQNYTISTDAKALVDRPKGWKMTTLGGIISSGLISNHNNKRYPLAGGERLKRQGVYPYYGAASAIDFIDGYKYDGFYLLVAEDGTVYDGKSPMLQLVKGKFWVSNHSHVLQGKDEIITKFLSYILKNINVSPYITGAVQPKLTKENLYSISFLIPENEMEQRAIAAVLSSLDDKIELLREQNIILEATAQAIFKEWFVNFNFPAAACKMIDSELGKIPEGWRVVKLGDVVDIRGGTTPSTENQDFWNGNIAWTSPKDLSNSDGIFLLKTEKKITKDGLKKIGSGLLPVGTLLLSSRAPIGYLAITNIEVAINQGYIAFLPDKYLSNQFMFLWLKLNMNTVIGSANGSTFLEISKSSFRNINCMVPENIILEKFSNLINPLFKKMLNNSLQIQTLSSLRDALLPKLMKGAIRVRGFND